MAVQREGTSASNFYAQAAFRKNGKFRDGAGFKKTVLDDWVADSWWGQLIGWIDHSEDLSGGYTLATTQEKLDEAANETEAAYKRFQDVRDKLLGNLKNDVTSASSSANKLKREFEAIQAAAFNAQTALLSPEMTLAIEHAERLATALRAISELKATRLSMAIFDTRSES